MNKKAFEMAISTVIVLVLALILLSVGIYIIYSKILKPTEGTTSVISCQARGGNPVSSCTGCVGVCFSLANELNNNKIEPCCISKTG